MNDDGSGCVVQADVPLAQVSLPESTVWRMYVLGFYQALGRRAIAWASPFCALHGAYAMKVTSVAGRATGIPPAFPDFGNYELRYGSYSLRVRCSFYFCRCLGTPQTCDHRHKERGSSPWNTKTTTR